MIFYEGPDEPKPPLRLRILRNIMLLWAMFVGLAGVIVIIALIALPPATAIVESLRHRGCQGEIPFAETVDAGGIANIAISTDRAEIAIVGRPGLGAIEVSAVACADFESRDEVGGITVEVSRAGPRLLIASTVPPDVQGGRVDLEVRVPESLPLVEIDTAEGGVFVSNVRDVTATLEDGDLRATHVAGDVTVPRLRGSLSLARVDGSVAVNQIEGFGTVDVARVLGSVAVVSNRSGPARISDVTGNVTVESAGFGDLTVARVRGDLRVDDNPRGEIRVEEVHGSVMLPPAAEPGT